jgi:hypothetical protein
MTRRAHGFRPSGALLLAARDAAWLVEHRASRVRAATGPQRTGQRRGAPARVCTWIRRSVATSNSTAAAGCRQYELYGAPTRNLVRGASGQHEITESSYVPCLPNKSGTSVPIPL